MNELGNVTNYRELIAYIDSLEDGVYYVVGSRCHERNVVKKLRSGDIVLDCKDMPATITLSDKPDPKAVDDYAYNRVFTIRGKTIHSCATVVSLCRNMIEMTGKASDTIYQAENNDLVYAPFGSHWITGLASDRGMGEGEDDMVKTKKYSRHISGWDVKARVHSKEISYGPQPVDVDVEHVLVEQAGIFDSVYSDGAIWDTSDKDIQAVYRNAAQAVSSVHGDVMGWRYTGPVTGLDGNWIVKGARHHLKRLWIDESNKCITTKDNCKSRTQAVAGIHVLPDTFSKVKGGSIGGQPLSCADNYLANNHEVKELLYRAILTEDLNDVDRVAALVQDADKLADRDPVIKAFLEAYKSEGLENAEEAAIGAAASKESILNALTSRANKHCSANFAHGTCNMLSITTDIYGILPKGFVATNLKAMGHNVSDGDVMLVYRSPAGTPGALVAVRVIDTTGGSIEAKMLRHAYGKCIGRIIIGAGVRDIFTLMNGREYEIGGKEHRDMFRKFWTCNFTDEDIILMIGDEYKRHIGFAKSIQVRFSGMDYDNDTVILSNVLKHLSSNEKLTVYEALKLHDVYEGVDAEGTLDDSITKKEFTIENSINFFKNKIEGEFGPTGIGAPAVYNQAIALLNTVKEHKEELDKIAKTYDLPVGKIGDNPKVAKLFDIEEDMNADVMMTAAEGLLQSALDNKAAQDFALRYLPVFTEFFFGSTLSIFVEKDKKARIFIRNFVPKKVYMPHQLFLRGFGPGASARFCIKPDLKDQSTWFTKILGPSFYDTFKTRIERVITNNRPHYTLRIKRNKLNRCKEEIAKHTVTVSAKTAKESLDALYVRNNGKLLMQDTITSRLYNAMSLKVQEIITPLIVSNSLGAKPDLEEMLPSEFKIQKTKGEMIVVDVFKAMLSKAPKAEFSKEYLMMFEGLETRGGLNQRLRLLAEDPANTEKLASRQRTAWKRAWIKAFEEFAANIDSLKGTVNSGIDLIGRTALAFISGRVNAGVNKILVNKVFYGKHPVAHRHAANVSRRSYNSIFSVLVSEYMDARVRDYDVVTIKTKAENKEAVAASMGQPSPVLFSETNQRTGRISTKSVSHNGVVCYALDGFDRISLTSAFANNKTLWIVKNVEDAGKFVEIRLERAVGKSDKEGSQF